jgi:hypothetical protein
MGAGTTTEAIPVIWDPRYNGCNWRKLRAAALEESNAHRAYAQRGISPPNTAPLTLWCDGRLNFDELLPDAGDKNGKNMAIKLSWVQLADFCGQDIQPDNDTTNIGDIGVVHRITGMSRSTLYGYRRYGLTVWQADDIAVNLGVHPSAIWPDWYEVTAALDQEAQ